MDLQILTVIISAIHSISEDAWIGSLFFYLLVMIPVFRQFEGEERITANEKLYHLETIYFRIWPIAAVVSSIALYIFPLSTITVILGRYSPLNIFIIETLILVAYIIAGEGFHIRFMRMYRTIYHTLEQKSRNSKIAHFVVLERKITTAMIIQLILLIGVIVVSHYFPISYTIP